MKKILLTLCAVLLAVPAFAVEVYNNGENSVGIYGFVNGYMGYGLSSTGDYTSNTFGVTATTSGSLGHNMMYGIQNNTRFGTNIKIGNVTAQFEIGANEKTLVNGASNTIGFRQAWAAYNFSNGSKLLVGKTNTPTSMGGIISSFYDTDGGLNGFGGMVRSNRRFQVAYSIAGVTLALIEDDIVDRVTAGSFSEGTYTDLAGNTKPVFTPRAGISYEFKNDALLAKIAATYTAVNGSYTNTAGQLAWTNLHAFGVALGLRPTFGNMWVGFHARYGMNEDLYGEGKTVANYGSYSHTVYSIALPVSIGRSVNTDGSFNDIHRAGAALEFGINVTDKFAAIIGGGYQATIQEVGSTVSVTSGTTTTTYNVTDPSYLVHSYAVFLQTPYKLSKNFALVPEIAWFGTIGKASANVTTMGMLDVSDSQNGLLVGVQFKASF